MLTPVMELLNIQRRMIICWYLAMLEMVIYIIIYQKILKKLLGKTKLNHFIIFHMGKVLIFLLLDLLLLLLFSYTNIYLVK